MASLLGFSAFPPFGAMSTKGRRFEWRAPTKSPSLAQRLATTIED